MKKRSPFSTILVVVLILVVIIAIVAIFLFVRPKEFSNEDILKNSKGAMDFCKNSPLDKIDECYYNVAQVLYINNTDASVLACLAISDEGFKNKCVGDLANKEENPTKLLELCNEITNDDNFKRDCYWKIDPNTKDLSIDTRLSMCDAGTSRDKDDCYKGIAGELWEIDPSKSLEICKNISDVNMKNECLNNFMGSPELIQANPTIAEEVCSLSSLTMKSNCYNNFARALSAVDPKQAAEVCKKLGDDVQISDCYWNVWFSFDSVILQNYDFSVGLCDILTLKKDECLRRNADIFMNSDEAKAEAICKLMSASASSSCLNNFRR